MTRKDYILLAEHLRELVQEETQTIARHEKEHLSDVSCRRARLAGVGLATATVANALAEDNPRFSREHFLAVVRSERGLNSRPPRNGKDGGR